MTTLSLIFAVLLGVAIRFVSKWIVAQQSKTKFNIKLAALAALLSVITNFALILYRADLPDALPMANLLAVFYGYLGDSAWRLALKLSVPKLAVKE